MVDNFNTLPDLGLESSYVGNPEDLEALFSDKSPEEIEKERAEAAAKKKAEEEEEKKTPKTKDLSGDELISSIKEDDEEEEEEENKDENKKEGKEDEEEEEDKDKEGQVKDLEGFTNDLFNLGVLSKDEEDNGKVYKTPEELLERFNREKQKGAVQWLEGFLSQFGDDRKELFDAIYFSGVDPKEYLPIHNSVQNFKNVDIAQEDTQKRVFKEFYKRVGLDEATIDKKLQKAIDYGDLEEESKTYLSQIIDQDEKKLEDLQQKEQQKRATEKASEEEYQRSISTILSEKLKTKEINGFPLNEQSAKRAHDLLTVKKWKAPDGSLLTELDKQILDTKRPENHWKRILLSLLFDSNFDFSKIEKKAITKESNTLFQSLAEKTKKTAVKKESASSIWNKI